MPAARYSEEFKAQIVREVIEKQRTIALVVTSYDLVAQTAGKWIASYMEESVMSLNMGDGSVSGHM